MPAMKNTTSDNLRNDVTSLADILDELLHSAIDKPKEQIDKLRNKAENMLKDARKRLSEASDNITSQTKEMADDVNTYVQENPWKGVSIAAFVGLVSGLLLFRR